MSGLSSRFTRDEMRVLLQRQGIPVGAIERTIEMECGPQTRLIGPASSTARILAELPEPARPTIELPFRLVLPWSALCSDNDKEEGYIRSTADGPKPARKLTDRYKTSKATIAARARASAGDVAPTYQPLSIRVEVWLPPARRNDAINFSKCVHDALEGIVYRNDNQLHDSRWIRAGVDIDAPRAEITISVMHNLVASDGR